MNKCTAITMLLLKSLSTIIGLNECAENVYPFHKIFFVQITEREREREGEISPQCENGCWLAASFIYHFLFVAAFLGSLSARFTAVCGQLPNKAV